jgi:hypothetical protein
MFTSTVHIGNGWPSSSPFGFQVFSPFSLAFYKKKKEEKRRKITENVLICSASQRLHT